MSGTVLVLSGRRLRSGSGEMRLPRCSGNNDTIDMRRALGVPKEQRFQVLAEHAPGTLFVDHSYLGVSRSPDALIVQVFLNRGRDAALKAKFFAVLADAVGDGRGRWHACRRHADGHRHGLVAWRADTSADEAPGRTAGLRPALQTTRCWSVMGTAGK